LGDYFFIFLPKLYCNVKLIVKVLPLKGVKVKKNYRIDQETADSSRNRLLAHNAIQFTAVKPARAERNFFQCREPPAALYIEKNVDETISGINVKQFEKATE